MIERAAILEHRSLTVYCRALLSEAAHRTIGKHENLSLSVRDRAAFCDVLMTPREPGGRLGRASAAKRGRLVTVGPRSKQVSETQISQISQI